MTGLKESIGRRVLDALGLVPASEVAEVSELLRDLDALGVPPAERLEVARAMSTYGKAGLTVDQIEPAVVIGARFLAHGFTGPEIDRMIYAHYERAARGS